MVKEVKVKHMTCLKLLLLGGLLAVVSSCNSLAGIASSEEVGSLVRSSDEGCTGRTLSSAPLGSTLTTLAPLLHHRQTRSRLHSHSGSDLSLKAPTDIKVLLYLSP